jgi:glyoxylase-like metal-dependent hydrolase (beta-lactamase superfamily II)
LAEKIGRNDEAEGIDRNYNSMKIGDWQLDSFVSGAFRLDGGAMFGVVPKSMWSKVAPADDENRISMVMRPLLIRGGRTVAIVDVGCGTGYGDKLTRIYAFEKNVPMADSLAEFDLTPQDVTDVFLTHLHFDHGGGVAYPDGDSWRLTFPNAKHHIQRAQYEHALKPNPRDRASFFRERIEIMDKEGVLELHDGEWTFAQGIDFFVCDGHTPGQQLPRLSDGDTTLFYCGDLVPTAAHLPTPYIMAYDLQPVVAMEEKTRMLDQAVAEGWILFFEHDPGIVGMRVAEKDGRYRPGDPVSV